MYGSTCAISTSCMALRPLDHHWLVTEWQLELTIRHVQGLLRQLCKMPSWRLVQEEGEEDDGEMAYVMEGVPAGSTISGLEIQCCDASGRSVPEGTAGKLRATWIRGTKKLQFDESGRFGLLALEVCHRRGDHARHPLHGLRQGVQ